jgi:hypothetical protein
MTTDHLISTYLTLEDLSEWQSRSKIDEDCNSNPRRDRLVDWMLQSITCHPKSKGVTCIYGGLWMFSCIFEIAMLGWIPKRFAALPTLTCREAYTRQGHKSVDQPSTNFLSH